MLTLSLTPYRLDSTNGFNRVESALDAALRDGVAPGVAVGLWLASDPDRMGVLSRGSRRTVPSVQPLGDDTVFDLASVTKVFSTATLAERLVERGWIRWTDPVSNFLPEFPHREIVLGHLAAHNSGLEAWGPLHEELRARFKREHPRLGLHEIPVAVRQQAMRRLACEQKPVRGLGEQAVYSDIGLLLLGFALEESLGGMPLDQAVKSIVWDPMGIRRAAYFRVDRDVAQGRREEIAATEDCPWRGGVIQGQVHDDNCWAMGGYGGHAGAFSDVESLLIFSRALFGGFLSRERLQEMWRRVPEPAGTSRTLGWDTPSGAAPSTGRFFSRETVGHLGYTGTSLWIDVKAGVAVALLTNRVHPTRTNEKIRSFRPVLHDALREDLLK